MIHRLGRPARLVLLSDWIACDSLLIRRAKGTLSSDTQDREDRNRSLVRDPLPGHPHQLTTEREYHFRFTALPEVMAQPVFSVSSLLRDSHHRYPPPEGDSPRRPERSGYLLSC